MKSSRSNCLHSKSVSPFCPNLATKLPEYPNKRIASHRKLNQVGHAIVVRIGGGRPEGWVGQLCVCKPVQGPVAIGARQGALEERHLVNLDVARVGGTAAIVRGGDKELGVRRIGGRGETHV